MSSEASDGKDAVQEVNWPGTICASADITELKELHLVELALESYSAEIHPAHDQIDVKTFGGGFDLTRRATAPKLRVGRD